MDRWSWSVSSTTVRIPTARVMPRRGAPSSKSRLLCRNWRSVGTSSAGSDIDGVHATGRSPRFRPSSSMPTGSSCRRTPLHVVNSYARRPACLYTLAPCVRPSYLGALESISRQNSPKSCQSWAVGTNGASGTAWTGSTWASGAGTADGAWWAFPAHEPQRLKSLSTPGEPRPRCRGSPRHTRPTSRSRNRRSAAQVRHRRPDRKQARSDEHVRARART